MGKTLSGELSCMLTALVVVESCMRTASEATPYIFKRDPCDRQQLKFKGEIRMSNPDISKLKFFPNY